MQQYNSKYFARSPPPSPQKVKIQLFQNMVMLHIKVNRECSNMVANDLGGVVKIYFFQNMVMLHIKLI